MKLICRWHRQALARCAILGDTLPAGSHLATHIAACTVCRQTWQDLRHLDSDLSQAFEMTAPSPAFTEGVRSRLTNGRPSRTALRPIPAMATVIVVLGIGGLLWWGIGNASHVLHRADQSYVASQPTDRNLRAAMPQSPSSPAPEKRRGSSPPKVAAKGADAQKSMLVKVDAATFRRSVAPGVWRRHHHSLRSHRTTLAHRRKNISPSPAVARTASPHARAEQWCSLGIWYEVGGDYSHAADAYGRAYSEQPDPALALEAGRNAEYAGDISEALGYYTRVLDQKPTQKASPQKGTSTWNDDHSA
jgi:hypothetical protein